MAATDNYPTASTTTPLTADDHGDQAADASVLTLAVAQQGIIGNTQDSDYFKFAFQAGHTYAFALNNIPRGTHLANGLLKLQGTSSAAAGATDAPLRFYAENYGTSYGVLTASYTGDYYLAVSGHAPSGDKAVDYTLAVREFSPDDIGNDRNSASPLAVDGKASGKLDYTGDTDWFKVHLQPGGSYALMLRGEGSGEGTLSFLGTEEGLRLFSANGNELPFQHSTVDGTRSFTAATEGDYYVVVDNPDRLYSLRSNASYTLHLQNVSGDTAGPVPAPATSSTNPVGLFDNIVISFNEPVGREHQTGILLLDASGSQVNGRVVSTGHGYVFDPIDHLSPGATYTIHLGFITDAAGNSYQGNPTFTFKARSADTQASAGNDLLIAYGNDAHLDGGGGCDMLVYRQFRSNADITYSAGELRVKTNTWSGTDVLTGVERLLFNDTALAFDTAGAGGQAYRLYQAAFDRAPDSRGVGYWIAQLDKGAHLRDVAQSFINSKEFATLYGEATSDAAFVGNLYQNVLHRAGDQAGADYWTGVLAKGASRAEVLTWFSEGQENQAAVLKIIGNGFEYTPYG